MKKQMAIFSVIFFLLTGPRLFSRSPSRRGTEINRLEQIELGGSPQWILARGQNPGNPVLLYLHGGPGFAMMPYARVYSAELEKHFIVVHWDQRGSGKSLEAGRDPATMKLERFLSDTHELIAWLKTTFHKKKIFLLGHSWGSILGLQTALRYPEDLFGYIGMGQVVDMEEGDKISYQFTLDNATNARDKEAIAALTKIGPPPYRGGFQSVYIQHMYLGKYGGFLRNLKWSDLESIRQSSPHYNDADQKTYLAGFGRSGTLLFDELMSIHFLREPLTLQVPVVFFAGRYDFGTPSVLAEKLLDKIVAPQKRIQWFEDSSHLPNLDEPVRFQEELIRWCQDVGRIR